MSKGLLTRNAVSEWIKGSHVLASIIMFSFIYLLLFWYGCMLLNDKVRKARNRHDFGRQRKGWLSASAARPLHEESMSEAEGPPRNGDA